MPSENTNNSQPNAKRQAILQSADKLFYRQGFHGTGISAIVAQANTTARTLYQHFEGKEGLILAVLQARDERFFEGYDASRAEHFSRYQSHTLAAVSALIDWFEREAAGGCLFLAALRECGDQPKVCDLVASHKQQMLARLQSSLERDGHSSNLANTLLLITEGATAIAPVLGVQAAIDMALQSSRQLLSTPQP